MKPQFVILLVFLLVAPTQQFGPLAQDGLNSMKDFFGGLDSSASSASNGLGGLASSMTQGMGGFGSIFQSILGSWSSIFSQLFSGGGDIFSTLFGVFQKAIESFFSILGGLTGSSRAQVNKMFLETGNVFASTMKLRLSPQKNVSPQKHQENLKKEILVAKKLVETPHKNANDLIKSVKAKAPKFSAAVSESFTRARAEFQKHLKSLNPEAKKGVQRMHMQVQQAKIDIGGILSSIMGMASSMMSGDIGSIFSQGMSIINNLFHTVGMVF